jgi:hypothetical protein
LGRVSLFRLPVLRRASTYPQMTRVWGDGGAEPEKGVLSGLCADHQRFRGVMKLQDAALDGLGRAERRRQGVVRVWRVVTVGKMAGGEMVSGGGRCGAACLLHALV